MSVGDIDQTAVAKRRPSLIGWEIGVALCLKAAGLALLYSLFFSPATKPVMTDGSVARHLLKLPGSIAGDEVHHD
jgi:hypothetical protein